MPEDAIDQSLRDIDTGAARPGTLREARPEFGARGGVTRPDDNPMAGRTIVERLTSFFGRKPRRDQGRSGAR